MGSTVSPPRGDFPAPQYTPNEDDLADIRHGWDGPRPSEMIGKTIIVPDGNGDPQEVEVTAELAAALEDAPCFAERKPSAVHVHPFRFTVAKARKANGEFCWLVQRVADKHFQCGFIFGSSFENASQFGTQEAAVIECERLEAIEDNRIVAIVNGGEADVYVK